MPWTANIPASESPSEIPVRGGASPGKPLMCRSPPIVRDRREPGALRVGAGLAVSRDPDEDDAGVHVGEPVVTELPSLEGAGAEVLGDRVCDADELEQELLPSPLAQVQRDALLVPRLHGPPERPALVPREDPFT
jgi:hypothetical protein